MKGIETLLILKWKIIMVSGEAANTVDKRQVIQQVITSQGKLALAGGWSQLAH